ncbi:hypothetical protein ARALYDRAFT_906802 [Arabidopsis lyrata subsp. lyrata]|uniref:Uncharacterized protein n=1 Tax=Arabidopsis lyrata subsp. lyrata TaxID=81972 RepID=D7LUP7_ARALL|nr:hypothetical protein ARALYDRAFT_906802 [Arabidopsis lyrata subsp. lyrata]
MYVCFLPGDAYNTSDPVNMDYRGAASIYADENQDKSPEVVVNHSPANVMLILGEIEEHHSFVAAVHRLQNLKCHNVLFAQPENKSVPLDFPISTKCLWETLSVGGLHIVQTEPVENTLKGTRRSPLRRFIFACRNFSLYCFPKAVSTTPA